MLELYERIYVGSLMACLPPENNNEWAVVHACKHPCHQEAVGYTGNLDKQHPNYLVLERENDLYLNMIDPPVPLFPGELFSAAMEFADKHWTADRKVLFHCNQGQSRAPSLALVFAAKVRGFISAASFEAARTDFERQYGLYAPGRGIETYLSENWDQI